MTNRRMFASALAIGIFTAPFIGAVPVSAADGERASGTIVLTTAISGTPLTLGADVVLYRRGPLYRLDLVSLKIPGADATTAAMISALLAPGGATVIYDGATGTLSAYSNANHSYYTQAHDTSTATALPPAATNAPRTGGDPLALLGNIAKASRDLQRAAIVVTGAGSVNGRPTTNIEVTLERRASTDRFHAIVALANDLDGFPLDIDAESHGWSGFTGHFKLDLPSVEAATPSDDTFAIPAGYKRVGDLGEVLRPH